MKVFYSVTSIVHKDGSANAFITQTKSAEVKPEQSVKHHSDKTTTVDWFDSYEEASKFADEKKSRGGRRHG